ncbi:MAG: peptide ABC transporter substrate-binding protein [Spirochaetales bacterium]|nr:MAG: peptide ABC transporter substrate-binding protein [Spirochaetales bacterium]
MNRGLLAYKAGTTELVPGLALSYDVNTAGDVYTFTLRRGIKFSDGTAFDANTVKWSIDRVMRIGGDPSWLVTDFVESVDVVDDYKVRFNLVGSVGFFPSLAASVPYMPVNPNIYPADSYVNDPSELVGGELVGLGPYKVVSFKRDEEIVLEANPEYYGTAPNVGRIVIRYYADATTMRLALEKGEVDLVYKDLNPSDKADLMTNSDYVTYEIPGAQIRYLCFETSESVLSNPKARQAVAALINRQEIIDRVFLGQQNPLYSMVPEGMIYHSPTFKSALGDANVAMAESLLKELGYTAAKPLAFDLWYTPSHYGDTEINLAEVLLAQLSATDLLDVSLKSAEWSSFLDNFDTKQMPAYLLGWYPDYIDPDNYTAAFGGTSGSAGMGIYYSDPEWDALFTTEQTNADPAVRADVFEELQTRWTVEVPTVPIFQGNLFVFTQKNVSGVKIGPTMIFNYDTLVLN